MPSYDDRLTEFEVELTKLINRYSLENGSNVPDYLLAQYLVRCLKTVNNLIDLRDVWFDRNEKFYG